jgi:hypothetical protein
MVVYRFPKPKDGVRFLVPLSTWRIKNWFVIALFSVLEISLIAFLLWSIV